MNSLEFLEVLNRLNEKLSFSGYFPKWHSSKGETFLSGQIPGFIGFSIYFYMGNSLEKQM